MATTPTKKHFTYTIKDFYEKYRKAKKKAGQTNEIVPYKVYRKIIEAFFLHISKKIIYENYSFMLPYSLGTLLVKAVRTNIHKAKIDYKKSKEFRKPIKLINTHTFGYYFMIKWDKSYTGFINNTYYLFSNTSSEKAERQGVGRQGLSDYIKTLSTDKTRRSYIKI